MQKLFWGNSQLDHAKKHLWVIGLNRVAKVVHIELVSVGSANAPLRKPGTGCKIGGRLHTLPAKDLVPSSPVCLTNPGVLKKMGSLEAYFN